MQRNPEGVNERAALPGSTLYDLHHLLQIAFAWTDTHLHQFLIRGQAYGITQLGGPWFTDDPQQVQLGHFRFHLNERFLYEYSCPEKSFPKLSAGV